jgi:hypothetical protein
MSHFGIPGVGGSLGQCAICGEPFAFEIITGASVKSFKQAGSDTTFYGHDECLEDAKRYKTLLDLPPESPLRQLYERQQTEQNAGSTD